MPLSSGPSGTKILKLWPVIKAQDPFQCQEVLTQPKSTTSQRNRIISNAAVQSSNLSRLPPLPLLLRTRCFGGRVRSTVCM